MRQPLTDMSQLVHNLAPVLPDTLPQRGAVFGALFDLGTQAPPLFVRAGHVRRRQNGRAVGIEGAGNGGKNFFPQNSVLCSVRRTPPRAERLSSTSADSSPRIRSTLSSKRYDCSHDGQR